MVTLEQLREAEIDLPVKKRVQALYTGTHALSKFAEDVVMPVLRSQLRLSSKEQAIVTTYSRMFAWMRSMVAMSSPIHFQGAASAARALFELLLDIKLLAADRTGEMVERNDAFREVELFRVDDKIVCFCDKHKGKANIDDSVQRAFVSKPGKRKSIEQKIIICWGRTRKGKLRQPQHWTGKGVRERARSLGFEYEELYVHAYPWLSWYVHAGFNGIGALDLEGMQNCLGYCHGIAQRVFADGTETCAEEMRISRAVPLLRSILDDLRLVPGKVLLREKIKLLREARAGAKR